MQKTMTLRRTLMAAVLGSAALFANAANAATTAPPGAPQASPAAIKRATSAAQAAAQRDFAQFVQMHLQRQGGLAADFPLAVTSADELRSATIAYGFPVYTIDPPAMLAGRGSMQSMARQTGAWRFVIAVAGRAVGLATVEKVNGRYETVAYGGAVLAKDLAALAGHYGNADKSNLRFLRIFQARSDLLEVMGEDNRARFAPMHSARQSLMLQPQAMKHGVPSGLLDETELQQPLRSAIRQNMAASQTVQP